ncbi:MAG TPA: hypothetical protein VD969_17665 [Symbiobacteriaceae bacterium]|nr:hypothetical protein [Symbiobacteriaceae bacterium]
MAILERLSRSLQDRGIVNARTVRLIPAGILRQLGTANALTTFRRAAAEVPAYSAFLAEHGVEPAAVQSIEDFKRLPLTDKAGYIRRYPTNQLSGKDGLHGAWVLQRSSGFSGQPTYWPRLHSDGVGNVCHAKLLWDLCVNPENLPTLWVITFSLCSWTGGTDLFHVGAALALEKKRNITVIAPGENLPEAVEVIRSLGPRYKRVFVMGNPPFLRRLLEADLDWPALHLQIATGAEPTTEAWRDWVAGRIGADPEREPMRIFNAYGASEFGPDSAVESPLTILLKRRAMKDPALARAIFGCEGLLPNLYQFDPSHTYLEEVGGEIVVTIWSGVPLIRYNIHDRGGVIDYDRMAGLLAEHGCDLLESLRRQGHGIIRLPFLWVGGRTDGTVSIGGANVYPGNIETAVFEDDRLSRAVEHFQLSVTIDGDAESRLTVYLGLRDGAEIAPEYAEEAILKVLLRDSSEYAATYWGNEKARPRVVIERAESLLDGSLKRRYIRPQG